MHGAGRGGQQVRHRLSARSASASAPTAASANTISSSHSGAGERRGAEGLKVVEQREEGGAQRTAGGGCHPP